MFGPVNAESISPQSTALVEAAASGNLAEIDSLLAAGADVNAPGLLALQPPGGPSVFGLMPVEPKLALSPLLAAASRGQAAAVQRLLERGADAKEDHVLYGTALHVAAQAGSPETIRLLLAAGLSATCKNKQGLTPRALIQTVRQQIDRTKNWADSMPQLKKIYDQLAAKLEQLPVQGWAACEELLCQAGG
jgi:ankyrin repeat protein